MTATMIRWSGLGFGADQALPTASATFTTHTPIPSDDLKSLHTRTSMNTATTC